MRSKKHRIVTSGSIKHRSSRLGGLGIGVLAPILAVGPNPGLAAEEEAGKAASQSVVLEEVIVTARRKGESLQDVPVTVNVVDSESLDDLNIRKLEDIQTVVPGLTLQENTILPNASMRGVRFNPDAASAGTIAFYLNDAPLQAQTALQAMFDVGQIEVLRGPQGTLRGVSAPSGSISITTQRPDLEEFNGHIDLTGTSESGRNAKAAVNVPILEDRLALRIAALREENEGNGVKSINSGETADAETDAGRVSLRFEPLDTLSFNLMYQTLDTDRTNYRQLESANRKDPTQPAPRQGDIAPEDRKTVSVVGEDATQEHDNVVLEAAWDFAENYRLNYVGARTDLLIERTDPADKGDAINPDTCAACGPEFDTFGQELKTDGRFQSHELRVSRGFEKVDVTLGALYQKGEVETDLTIQTAVILPAFFGVPPFINDTPVTSDGTTEEQSIFGNVTVYLTEATELVAGLRKLKFEDDGTLDINGSVTEDKSDDDDLLYLLSLKHRYSDNLMLFATAGSAMRPGVDVKIGRNSTTTSAREQSFLETKAESSDSLELGFKADLLGRRLRVNGSVFYQQFDDYAFKPTENTYYIANSGTPSEQVASHRYISGVPLDVYGLELDAIYQVTEQWNISGTYSLAEGKIDDGTVPCNDFAPADGKPDGAGSPAPTATQIRNASGGDNVAACEVDYRANNAPLWIASLQSQYDFPLFGLNGYVRGLATLFGDSRGDPTNSLDDTDRYGLLNLYTGVRDPNGVWEVMLFAKNVTEVERVTSRNANPAQVQTPFGAFVSTYREITMTPEREFGINLRYNF